MNLIGYLYGMNIHISEHCGIKKRIFTRKQTRKFKNRRWVKKYEKKYSYVKMIPQIVSLHDKIIMHPEAWEKIKTEKERLDEGTNIGNDTHSSFRQSESIIQGYDRSRECCIPTFGVGCGTFDPQSCA